MIGREENGFIKSRGTQWINPEQIVKYGVELYGDRWTFQAFLDNGQVYTLYESNNLEVFLASLREEGFNPTLPECAFCHQKTVYLGRTCTTCKKSTSSNCQCSLTQIRVAAHQLNHYCPDCGVPEGIYIWEPIEVAIDDIQLTRWERIREFAAYTLTRPILPAIFGRG